MYTINVYDAWGLSGTYCIMYNFAPIEPRNSNLTNKFGNIYAALIHRVMLKSQRVDIVIFS